MSIYNKTNKTIADIVSNIMSEKLHPNQQKLDVHEPEKDKLTADDFKKLRSMKKEEAEQLKEYESKNGSYTHKGTYGYAGKGAEHGDTDYAKENDMAKDADKPKKPNRAKYGARQNFKRSTRVNEGFSSMFDALQEKGLKGLQESMVQKVKAAEEARMKKEEVDNDTYAKELEDQKAKSEGKKKGADIAKASVQAVQNEETHSEIQVIDMTQGDQPIEITKLDLEEKTLTEPETKKKEEVVKSMKKKLSSFKDRYGDNAKSVMYATATKIAKDKA